MRDESLATAADSEPVEQALASAVAAALVVAAAALAPAARAAERASTAAMTKMGMEMGTYDGRRGIHLGRRAMVFDRDDDRQGCHI